MVRYEFHETVTFGLSLAERKFASLVYMQKLGRPLRIEIQSKNIEFDRVPGESVESVGRCAVANEPGEKQVIVRQPARNQVVAKIPAMLLFASKRS
jgi:FPC/CPF motif-containing protein YcgG